jgi:hypothetical protein
MGPVGLERTNVLAVVTSVAGPGLMLIRHFPAPLQVPSRPSALHSAPLAKGVPSEQHDPPVQPSPSAEQVGNVAAQFWPPFSVEMVVAAWGRVENVFPPGEGSSQKFPTKYRQGLYQANPVILTLSIPLPATQGLMTPTMLERF